MSHAELEYIPLTAWICISCGHRGDFERPGDDASYLVMLIRAAASHRIQSPECVRPGLWVEVFRITGNME
jgi:uncharacterized protein (DUF983 family)